MPLRFSCRPLPRKRIRNFLCWTPLLAITLPEAFGGDTVNFDPFTPDRLGPFEWFRFAAMAALPARAMVLWKMEEWIKG